VALITGIVHILLPGNTALMGASGIVFAFILLSSVTGTGKGIPLTTIIVALIYITQQVYEGVTAADNISQLTHIIGGTIGAVYGLTMKRK
jgi:GlpG protein